MLLSVRDVSSSSVHASKLTLVIPQILLIGLYHRLTRTLEKDVLGIMVSYKIKVNLMVAGGG